MSDLTSLYDAKTHLSQLVDRAAEGEEIVIAKNGVARARLVGVAFAGARRVPAGALGLVRMADDFDAKLPEALAAVFEGRN